MENNRQWGRGFRLVDRADILSILLSSFLQGGDRSTLLAIAAAFDLHRDFISQARKLETERVITLDIGKQ